MKPTTGTRACPASSITRTIVSAWASPSDPPAQLPSSAKQKTGRPPMVADAPTTPSPSRDFIPLWAERTTDRMTCTESLSHRASRRSRGGRAAGEETSSRSSSNSIVEPPASSRRGGTPWNFARGVGPVNLRRMRDHHDVAIVGASAAGCAAATLLARRGLRVALVERSPDPDSFKTVCTHYIQASATPAIRRLGLAERIESAGGLRNSIDLWTRYGWVRHPGAGELPHGYSIRRERLDPLARSLAMETPGVEPLLGTRAVGLVERDGRVAGVRVAGRDGEERELRARLVVAADGRSSKLAELADVPGRSWPNRRHTYWAYFRGLPLRTPGRAQLWFLDPCVAYAFPNDDDLTLVASWGLHRDLDEFRADTDHAVRAQFAELPDAPRLADGEQVSRWLGKVDMPNIRRAPVHRGMALVGDAAQASDPVWGVGLGWAFQSAEWLAEAVAPALAGGGDLDAALGAYRARHRRELAVHHLLISDYSRGRRFRAAEKLVFAAGARDPEIAKRMHLFAGRVIGAHEALSPATLARAALVLSTGVGRSSRAGGVSSAGPPAPRLDGDSRPPASRDRSEPAAPRSSRPAARSPSAAPTPAGEPAPRR